MTGPIAPADLIEVLDHITFDDEKLVRLRQAFATKAALDEATIEASVGIFAEMQVAFLGDRFDVNVEGVELEPAFVIGALNRYESIADLVAWRIQRPAEIATYAGHADLLGQPFLGAFRFHDEPVPVFRTAARWLRAGGRGIVPIGPRSSRALLDIDAPLLAEDDEHGAELAAARQQIVRGAPQILVAEPSRRAA